MEFDGKLIKKFLRSNAPSPVSKVRQALRDRTRCSYCKTKIVQPNQGFVIQGNIYSADEKHGLIGDSFPKMQNFQIEDVKKIICCMHCLKKALGII